MYSGLQKAQLILSLLEDESGVVLSNLSTNAASILGASMGNMPEYSNETIKPVLVEFHENLKRIQMTPDSNYMMDFVDPMASPEFDLSSEVEEALGEKLSTGLEDSDTQDTLPSYFEYPDRVVTLLRDQKPQVAAFIYHGLDIAQRQELSEFLTTEEVDRYEQENIEDIPLSPRIFETMLSTLKEESEREEDPLQLSDDPSDSDLTDDVNEDEHPAIEMSDLLDDSNELSIEDISGNSDKDGLDMSLDIEDTDLAEEIDGSEDLFTDYGKSNESDFETIDN